jgi:ISXO2-like transposase domain
MSYMGLKENYRHDVIDHAEKYVDGQVHTNGLENFWSLLKRGLKGTYMSVEPFHLFRYLDEQVFRYNFRALPSLMPRSLAKWVKRVTKPGRLPRGKRKIS